MVEYNTVNAKLSNSQLSKLKSAVKNRQGTILRMNARILSANDLPHELLLTTRQTTKLRNAIENNMTTDIKLSKSQISKIIQSGGFLQPVTKYFEITTFWKSFPFPHSFRLMLMGLQIIPKPCCGQITDPQH